MRVTPGLLSALAQLPPLAYGRSMGRQRPVCPEQPSSKRLSSSSGSGPKPSAGRIYSESGGQPLAFQN